MTEMVGTAIDPECFAALEAALEATVLKHAA
jgi:hypothetical protein